MLEFVLGRAGTGKTTRLREALARCTDRPAILLVPEQYTFESERALLETYGVETANRVRVYSFTRLAEAAFLRYGGGAGKRLTDGGRRILMTLAVESCLDRLTLFEKSATSGKLTETMLTAVGELKICGVTPETLTAFSARLSDPGLTQKLQEISLIYGAFEALVAQTYLDPLDDLTRLDALLAEHPDFFSGAFVAVDAFDGFTVQEYRVLRHALRAAERITVALCTEDLDTSKRDLFSPVRRTAERLRRMAREENVPVASPVRLQEPLRFQNRELMAVEAMLACGEAERPETAEHVRALAASSPYEETEYAAAAIRELVLSGTWRYRDVSIVCRDEARYGRILAAALRRWDIPAFLSEKRAVDAEPVMRFVLSAFEAAGGWSSESILTMLKTGLTALSPEEIAALENYIFIWKLNGRAAWQTPFTKHPEGYGHPMDEEAEAALARLNGLREQVAAPLQRFAASIRTAPGEEIARAVYTLLTDYKIDESLPVFCRALESAGRPELAAQQVRLWDLLMSVLDQMAGVLGDREITGARFGELLRDIVRGEDVYDIPQNIDTVTFGSADRLRQSAPRAVFLLGAVQGEFPLVPTAGGVFSDAERRALLAAELPLSDALEDRMLHERYLAYAAATSASERLYISYPAAAEKETKSPSELLRASLDALPALQIEKPAGAKFLANAPEAAFSEMASLFRENTAEAETLRAVFADRPEYAGRIAALGGEDRMAHARLSGENAHRLFGAGRVLSASQIETYHQCRFRYFCRYAIGAKERRPAELDALEYGSLMHDLFETVIGDKDEDVTSLEKPALEEKIRRRIRAYADENMGGFADLSPREQYRFRRMARTAVTLIGHVAEELRVSKFQPKYFELALADGTGFPPLKIPTDDGFVRVGGVVDRVDVFESPEGKYVRVVDYKTGRKTFRLSDVLYGLSLQMLVYLAALTERSGAKAAGVLYMPAFVAPLTSDKTESPEALQKSAEENLKMNGMILNDTEIVRAMEEDLAGRFIPVKLRKDGGLYQNSALVERDAFDLVLRFVKRLVATMAETLRAGDVAAKPLSHVQNACATCPYAAVCGSERGADEPEKVKMQNSEVLARMAEETERGGNA